MGHTDRRVEAFRWELSTVINHLRGFINQSERTVIFLDPETDLAEIERIEHQIRRKREELTALERILDRFDELFAAEPPELPPLTFPKEWFEQRKPVGNPVGTDQQQEGGREDEHGDLDGR